MFYRNFSLGKVKQDFNLKNSTYQGGLCKNSLRLQACEWYVGYARKPFGSPLRGQTYHLLATSDRKRCVIAPPIPPATPVKVTNLFKNPSFALLEKLAGSGLIGL
ncbi:hypothetical protein BV375_32745 [Nostoc sp. 106C]|nr:hypothetical protein BV375_32745 [Nostoc sp. 106C]